MQFAKVVPLFSYIAQNKCYSRTTLDLLLLFVFVQVDREAAENNVTED